MICHGRLLEMVDTRALLQMTEIAEHLAEDMAEEGLQVGEMSLTTCMYEGSDISNLLCHAMLLAVARATWNLTTRQMCCRPGVAPGWGGHAARKALYVAQPANMCNCRGALSP